MQTRTLFRAVFLVLLATGCSDHISELDLTATEASRVAAVQNPFGANLVRMEMAGSAEPILIGLRECKVYRAELEQGIVKKWTYIHEIDGNYPLPSSCSRESIGYDGQYVTIEFCKTPFGAGGGCAGGISPHRSSNGIDWEVRGDGGKWNPVANQW